MSEYVVYVWNANGGGWRWHHAGFRTREDAVLWADANCSIVWRVEEEKRARA